MKFHKNIGKFMAAGFLVAAFSSAAYAQEFPAPSADAIQTDSVCQLDIEGLTRLLVERDFPGEKATFFVRAYNDVLCEVPEDMANIVAVAKKIDGETLYGIFHIHTAHNATILTTAVSFNDDMRWEPLTTEADWKAPWCDLIKYVYGEELESQGCPLPTNS